MKMLKKIKTDMWINVFMMLLIGILFIVRPQDSLEVTAIIAGAVIFANGIFDLIYYLRVWADFYSRGSLFEGIMKCVLGIFIFTHAGITTVLFSYVFSIYIIINGIICMETAIYMQRTFEVILYHIQKISRQSVEKIQDAVDELSGNIIDEDDVK